MRSNERPRARRYKGIDPSLILSGRTRAQHKRGIPDRDAPPAAAGSTADNQGQSAPESSVEDSQEESAPDSPMEDSQGEPVPDAPIEDTHDSPVEDNPGQPAPDVPVGPKCVIALASDPLARATTPHQVNPENC